MKRAAPDGYTFLFGTNSPLAVVPNMQKEPPYDVVTDFTPVTYLGDNSFFIVVHPSVPATSLPQLIAVAKSSATPLTYATGNTYAFVTISMLAKSNGLKLEAVRYKSEPDAITDMLAGRVQVMNGTATSLLAHIKAGKLRALSTSFEGRSPLLPELPSLIEAGQPAAEQQDVDVAAAPLLQVEAGCGHAVTGIEFEREVPERVGQEIRHRYNSAEASLSVVEGVHAAGQGD